MFQFLIPRGPNVWGQEAMCGPALAALIAGFHTAISQTDGLKGPIAEIGHVNKN